MTTPAEQLIPYVYSNDYDAFQAATLSALDAQKDEILDNLRAAVAADIFNYQEVQEVEEPASRGEKRFKDKHRPKRAYKNPDEILPSVTVQKDMTKRASYENGEDKLVYEAADVPVMKLDGVKGEIASSNPTRVRTALGGLRRLCREKLAAEEANDKIAVFMVDPNLMDQIEAASSKNSSADVRPLIKFRLKRLGVDTSNW